MMFPNRKTAMAIETPARRLRRFLATFEIRGPSPWPLPRRGIPGWANWRSHIPIDLAEWDARRKVLDWRDRELAAITRQLEAAFPTLLLQIQVHVAGMSALQITRAQVNPRKLTDDLLGPRSSAAPGARSAST